MEGVGAGKGGGEQWVRWDGMGCGVDRLRGVGAGSVLGWVAEQS